MVLISQILTVGLLATLAMTIFSYAFSYIFHGNFKEPQLLNYLADKLPGNPFAIASEHILGWVIHLSIGTFFTLIFTILYSKYSFDLSLLNGIVFGGLAGLIGMTAWKLFFSLHPHPPKINKTLFYFQLFLAHLVFGGSLALLMRGF